MSTGQTHFFFVICGFLLCSDCCKPVHNPVCRIIKQKNILISFFWSFFPFFFGSVMGWQDGIAVSNVFKGYDLNPNLWLD